MPAQRTQLDECSRFPRFAADENAVPIFCATSQLGPSIHRFYDTSPISPSGRFLVVTEFPYEDRLPQPGDAARVVVLDLTTDNVVYETKTAAWDTQVGAHAQWGPSDEDLFFNRMELTNWHAYAVRVNVFTRAETVLSHPVYMVSNKGDLIAGPNLPKITLCQAGYGVNIPSSAQLRHTGAPKDDGLFIADTDGGSRRLLVSLEQIAHLLKEVGKCPDLYNGGLYGFHVKWNFNDTKLMFLVRWLSNNSYQRGTLNYLITANRDGTDLRLGLDATRWAGGHHPNWHPDGERIVMNLRDKSAGKIKVKFGVLAERVARKLKLRYFSNANPMRFYTFRFDGTDLQMLAPGRPGSGHPTIHTEGRYLLTDAYPGEQVAEGNGTVPLRWVNLTSGDEVTLAKPRTAPPFSGPNSELRVDPHPAWDRSGRYVAFNACPDGVRRVYIADMSGLLKEYR